MRGRSAVAIAIVSLSVAACRREATYEKPLTAVRIQVASSGASLEGVRYAASIEPNRRIDLAFKSGGYIQSLAMVDGREIKDGDRVTRGMVLARVTSTDYDEKVKQARSVLAEAEAAGTAAKQAYARATQLFEARSATRPEVEQARAAWDTVQAKLAGAQALVQEAENARADTVLASPLDGILLKRLIEVGSLVGPGVGGFVLADISSVRVVFGAPDTMLQRLRRGMAVRITSEALPGRDFQGRITNIAPTADPRSRVFDVELTVPNHDAALKVGMVASAQLQGDVSGRSETASRLTVPLSAIVRSKTVPEGYAVFVLDEGSGSAVARLRDVTLGPMIGDAVGIVDGLRPGDKVIVSGATIIADGEPVRVVL